MIVIKFGGTSVGSVDAIRRAAKIVLDRKELAPVVVASAMSGVTDRLVAATSLAAEGTDDSLAEALEIADDLDTGHRAVLDELVPEGSLREQAECRVESLLGGLRSGLEELARAGSHRLAATDDVLAHGELLSTTILAAHLGSSGHDARWIDARKVVVSDKTHGRAVPDMEATRARAEEHLRAASEGGAIPVIQGFVAGTEDGVTTTLGRGGSDFTAAILGAVLDVTEVQIWTDVHGLLTADPRVVPEARLVAEATYDEAAELAFFGAKVLHPATMIPLIEAEIPVRVLNSMDPDANGTRISSVATGRPGEVKSIASRRGVTIISIQAPRMLGTHGFLKKMFGIFDRHEVSLDVVSTSEVSISVSIEDGAVTNELLTELETLGETQVRPDRAVICVVGENLREMPGVAARIFSAVTPNNVEMISQGASEINVTLVVNGPDAERAVRQLHREFFPDD